MKYLSFESAIKGLGPKIGVGRGSGPKIRVGRVTVNSHIFFLAYVILPIFQIKIEQRDLPVGKRGKGYIKVPLERFCHKDHASKI